MKLLLFLALFFFTPSSRANTPQKPNIVFILTDDTGYGDLSAHGHPLLKTPNLDRLHSQSVRFTDFHVSPTCSPTRSALLTGRHEFKNGVTHTILERERLTLKATTLPQVLQQAGYQTGIFGKWHLGDEEPYQPLQRGFHEAFIHGGGGIGQTFPGSCGDAPENRYFNPVIRHNGVFEKTEGFCTDIFTNAALQWMERQSKDKPFFCYIPYNAAHAPYSCPEADKAPFLGKVSEPTATYLGMVSNIDTNVGRILDWLDATDRANNTLVVFMNDNGVDHLGGKVFNAGMRGYKASPWMGGTRAVSLWRWSNTFKPHDSDALTAHIDVFPTLASLAGAQLPPEAQTQIEGRSLRPLLEQRSNSWPDRILITHVGRWPKNADVQRYKFSNASVRNASWHLVWEQRGPNPEGSAAQLFNIKADPSESTNVAADNPQVLEELKQSYNVWWNSVTPLMVNENAEGPPMNPFKEAYWKQFGGHPSSADLQQMSPERVKSF